MPPEDQEPEQGPTDGDSPPTDLPDPSDSPKKRAVVQCSKCHGTGMIRQSGAKIICGSCRGSGAETT